MNSDLVNMEAGFPGITGDNVYEVERVLRKRHHPSKGIQYLVKWRGFPNSDNTWEPACNFPQKVIADFESLHQKKKPRLSVPISTTSSENLLPSSSSSFTSSCPSSTTTTSGARSRSISESQRRRSRGRPRKDSQKRQQQIELQRHIEKKQGIPIPVDTKQLAIFNPVGDHSLPVAGELIYEPKLTKEPIIVTDVTTKDLTVTISECETSEGFFRA